MQNICFSYISPLPVLMSEVQQWVKCVSAGQVMARNIIIDNILLLFSFIDSE